MIDMRAAAAAFLAHRRIAVTGVSHAPKGHGSNTVYVRLRERGYSVFAVNPNAPTVEGDPAYPNLRAIPGGVEAVVIGTRPEHALAAVEEAAALGIRWVWMHRGFGGGSVSPAAAARGRELGLTVIDGGCPLMFDPTGDLTHKCMRPLLTWMGAVPREIAQP
jgi:uncharacterized protein